MLYCLDLKVVWCSTFQLLNFYTIGNQKLCGKLKFVFVCFVVQFIIVQEFRSNSNTRKLHFLISYFIKREQACLKRLFQHFCTVCEHISTWLVSLIVLSFQITKFHYRFAQTIEVVLRMLKKDFSAHITMIAKMGAGLVAHFV